MHSAAPLAALVGLVGLVACRPSGPVDVERLRADVTSTERAFARTMAERDYEGFAAFLSPEAVFFSGDDVLRGSAAIGAAWRGYFADDSPPFAWEPAIVEVLDSGMLALSSGPVYGTEGDLIGTFNSIWRLDRDGRWRIVFDKGSSPPCECD